MSVRIGVFGGTFDPIHIGHLIAASEVHTALNLDRLLFMPAGQPWQKAHVPVTPAHQRYEMVCAAVADDSRFEASDIEVNRTGPTYAIDTVHELRSKYPDAEIVWIVGADVLASLTTWHEWELFVEEVEIAAVNRAGIAMTDVPFEYLTIEMPDIRISASELRSRLAQDISCKYLIQDSVLTFIAEQGLYR